MSTTVVRSDTLTGRASGLVVTMFTGYPAVATSASTIAITPIHEDAKYYLGYSSNPIPVSSPVGTSTMTINVTTTSMLIGDRVHFNFAANSSANLVVTFGTSMVSSGTLTVTEAKFGSIHFTYDGTNLVEDYRTITV